MTYKRKTYRINFRRSVNSSLVRTNHQLQSINRPLQCRYTALVAQEQILQDIDHFANPDLPIVVHVHLEVLVLGEAVQEELGFAGGVALAGACVPRIRGASQSESSEAAGS